MEVYIQCGNKISFAYTIEWEKANHLKRELRMPTNGLKSVVDIFERKVFRIPDYQRGYAWEERQLEDFWEDIRNISDSKIHYTGVLTLERVEKQICSKWDDDKWLIEGKGFTPYFVVDGQQRLITIVILLKVIIDKLSKEETLNYDSKDEITSKYIFQSRDQGVSRSYIFGYEKDNPSYEFLKTRIFEETSNTNQNIETLYTANLERAKIYFYEIVEKEITTKKELEALYKKVTLGLKFNVYEIEEDLDVFVAFETMNNRGKMLSQLELLKNRLIYLSTLLSTDANEKNTLRKNINESWKTIYEYLGKNKDKPLNDDEFLKNHWIMYFQYSRETANKYAKFLLDEHFTAKRVLDGNLKSTEIQQYITSIQDSVKRWYDLFNPEQSNYSDELKWWLNKMNRLDYGAFAPLTMAVLTKNDAHTNGIIEFLKKTERYNFLIFKVSQRKSNTKDSEFYQYARSYYKSEKSIDEITMFINAYTLVYFNRDYFFSHIQDKFNFDNLKGFYNWNGLEYFLFEYDLYLRDKSKASQIKINLDEYDKYKKDFISIEHVYPQTATEK